MCEKWLNLVAKHFLVENVMTCFESVDKLSVIKGVLKFECYSALYQILQKLHIA